MTSQNAVAQKETHTDPDLRIDNSQCATARFLYMIGEMHQYFPRGVSSLAQGVIANTEFARTETILTTPSLSFNVPNDEGRILLGSVNSDLFETSLSGGRIERYAMGGSPIGVSDDRHMLTVAGSRAGKGRSVVIPNHILYQGSILTNDPKGEIATLTADWRANMLGHEVVTLDPFGITNHKLQARYRGGFNPMAILSADSPSLIEDSGVIADALIVSNPDEQNPHWNESARLFLSCVIVHVATCPNYIGKRNLIEVYQYLSRLNQELEDSLLASDISYVQDVAVGYLSKPDDERGSVLSTLRRHIHFLSFPNMQQVLTEHSFDLSQLKTSKLTVYLCLPATKMGICAGWLRLFVNMTLSAMETVQVQPKHPVLLCLDEFAVLGHMKSLQDAVGQIAGLGCKLWPILQDLGQLKALYGKRWETFIENSGVLQFFGNSGLETLDWVSKRLGQTTIQSESSKTASYRALTHEGDSGHSWGQQSHPLMTAEEISRFFGRDDVLLRQLIIRPTWPAMVLHRIYYDKHPLFAKYRQFYQTLP